MENPFPGMNPYLEDRHLWPTFRFPFVVYLSNALNRVLPKPYWSGFGRREFKIDASTREFSPWWIERRLKPEAAAELPYEPPIEIEAMDEGVAESYVKIYHSHKPGKLIAILDVVGPISKMPGTPGRKLYLKQQRRRLESNIHLVEIDLLRGGEQTVACPFGARRAEEWDYLVCRHLAGSGNKYQLWPTTLQNRLPRIPIPLASASEHVVIDLQAIVNQCCESGRYELQIDYDRDCTPPLSEDNAKWADDLLRKKKLRQ